MDSVLSSYNIIGNLVLKYTNYTTYMQSYAIQYIKKQAHKSQHKC